MRLAPLFVLVAALPALSGCAAAVALSAAGLAAQGARGKPQSNEAFQSTARAACSERAAQYGKVAVIDVEQRRIDKIIVWGTVEAAGQKRSFQCNFGKQITGFTLRQIRSQQP